MSNSYVVDLTLFAISPRIPTSSFRLSFEFGNAFFFEVLLLGTVCLYVGWRLYITSGLWSYIFIPDRGNFLDTHCFYLAGDIFSVYCFNFCQSALRSTCCSRIYGFLLHHRWARGEKSLTGHLCVGQLGILYHEWERIIVPCLWPSKSTTVMQQKIG
jgi:hypothetical protein